MPKYSILMPTRNRASLLNWALETAISIDYDDFEIVVSDNNSTDNTKEIYEKYAKRCDKIRYINPGKDLDMCSHWEFISNAANGDYLLYLSDDDAIPSNLLKLLDKHIEFSGGNPIVWRPTWYNHPDVPDKQPDNMYNLDLRSTKQFIIPSEILVKAFFNFEKSVRGFFPVMLNSLIKRELFLKAKQKTGTFFMSPFPDYSAACHLLGICPYILYVDLPYYIAGASYISNAGMIYNRKKKFEDYISLFGEEIGKDVIYPMRYLINTYFAKTLLIFSNLYPSVFGKFKINNVIYLTALYKELQLFKPYEDISSEEKDLANYMKIETGNEMLFLGLMNENKTVKNNLISKIKPLVLGNVWLHRLMRFVQKFMPPPTKYSYAYSATTTVHSKVKNIVEASKILTKYLEKFRFTNPISNDKFKPIDMTDCKDFEELMIKMASRMK